MIALLTGRLVSRSVSMVEIETSGGTGYEVHIPLSAFEALPREGDVLTLHTHLTVREDAWELYGFVSRFERSVFRRLLSAKGVGPALALGILSTLGAETVVDEVRQNMMVWGQTPDPFALWLLERGLKTLDVRVKRQNESAQRIAEWATTHPAIARVHYPGLPTHPDHALARELLDGFGGMLAFELAAGGDATASMLEKLRLVTHAPSLGGVDSLVSEPRYTSHAAMTPAARAAIGIPDGFLRFSIGLEDADDLIADFAQALG
jgi:hypothetical protein